MTAEGTQVSFQHVPESKSSFCRIGGGLLTCLRSNTLNFYDVNHNPTVIE